MNMFQMVQNEKKHMNKMREMEANGNSKDEQLKYLKLKIHWMGTKAYQTQQKKD